ncbi:MAG TPA: SAM-dependent methyltransferase [Vicinamibacterales bacterium]|nr:SAM-dependent methyltransferase [Vicinamibacterales bacterium]
MSTVTALDQQRQFFAEEIEAVARLKTPALVSALAAVPRERFLPPGPWTTLGDLDFLGGGSAAKLVATPDADPKRVYHNIGIAIDPARQLFNGQPSTLATWIDALGLGPGKRVLHIGAGLGYYTAVMAHSVGSTGRVVAYEVDEALAAAARPNLATYSWADLRHGDASGRLDGPFDAVLVNAGVTHPLDSWLDALAPDGRLIVPLTTGMPGIGTTLGKGLTFLLTKNAAGDFAARVFGVVMVYSAVGVRDEKLTERFGKAMMGGPQRWQAVTRLRRDAHEQADTCWLHGGTFCLSA